MLRLSEAATAVLLEYDWPGNVRELANVMATAAALCGGGLILPEHLPRRVLERVRPQGLNRGPASQIQVNGVAAGTGGVAGTGGGAGAAIQEPGAATQMDSAASPAVGTPSDAPGGARELTQLSGLATVLDAAAGEAEALLRAGDNVNLEGALEKADGFRDELARRVIKRALSHTLGDRRAAADVLGISVRTLRYLLREKK
jgi:DNA-binding NtrC family response regulator